MATKRELAEEVFELEEKVHELECDLEEESDWAAHLSHRLTSSEETLNRYKTALELILINSDCDFALSQSRKALR